jgi:LysR family transcriptional regulator, regulator for genes of the gallate degradation pathway
MKSNLRHLRVFLAVAQLGSVSRAAEACNVSQPAVTQAIGKLERMAGTSLFRRTSQGIFVTGAGAALAERVRRAFALLDPALGELAPRLRLTATTAQLQALIAMREAENFTLAARRLGIAQPTVHRAITQLEQEAARALFERTSYGMIATRPAQALAQAARLAFAELDQAEADLAEAVGREVGGIVVGAMPLSRSHLLPRAIARFRDRRPTLPVKVLDGPYDDLLAGLRRGEIDFLIGAMRDPAPIGDVVQEPLFHDSLVLVGRRDHPLFAAPAITLADLAGYPWVVASAGTPTRQHFDALFAPLGADVPKSIVESGSLILMRELLRESDHLGCISRLQVARELAHGTIAPLPYAMDGTGRPIGLTLRVDWMPTLAQRDFLSELRGVAAD